MAIDFDHPLYLQPFAHHLVSNFLFPMEGHPVRCSVCECLAGFSSDDAGHCVVVCPECGRFAYKLGDFLCADWDWVPPHGS